MKFLLLGNGVENTLYRISDWTIKKGIKDKLSKFKISAQNINKSFIGYYTSEIDTSVLKVRNMMIKNRKGIMIEKASKKNVLKVLNIVEDELRIIQNKNLKIVDSLPTCISDSVEGALRMFNYPNLKD